MFSLLFWMFFFHFHFYFGYVRTFTFVWICFHFYFECFHFHFYSAYVSTFTLILDMFSLSFLFWVFFYFHFYGETQTSCNLVTSLSSPSSTMPLNHYHHQSLASWVMTIVSFQEDELLLCQPRQIPAMSCKLCLLCGQFQNIFQMSMFIFSKYLYKISL